MTLSDMAREIERRRPGTLPKSVRVQQVRRSRPLLTIDRWTTEGETDGSMALVNDLAQAILRDAMVMAIGAAVRRIRADGRGHGWFVRQPIPDDDEINVRIWDADHGNDPTRSLFAAFCAAFPEAKP